jgi:uncharacterized Tic20 family protein
VESTAAGTAPQATIALRDGGSVDLWPDRLVFPAGAYWLADVVWAGLVTDTSALPTPFGQPVPALGLRLRDGRGAIFSPADPANAIGFLDAILALRPELRPDLRLPPALAYSPAPGTTHPSGVSDGERALAGICHLSVFFVPLLLPLIVWLVVRESMPYASQQAKQAFFFHLLIAAIAVVVIVVPLLIVLGLVKGGASALVGHSFAAGVGFLAIAAFFVGFGLMLLLVVCEIVFAIYAAVQAFQGRPFHYPLLGRI